jgi:hypothetical protein
LIADMALRVHAVGPAIEKAMKRSRRADHSSHKRLIEVSMKTRHRCALAAIALAAATPALAMGEKECMQTFEKADADRNGTLTEAEATRYYAAMRVANKPVADGKMTQDVFLTNCRADLFAEAKMDSGAPHDGANSFTQNQAKDRVLKAGFTNVSELAKDDKGVWRGTAMQSGAKVNVAVDYQGNVVAN